MDPKKKKKNAGGLLLVLILAACVAAAGWSVIKSKLWDKSNDNSASASSDLKTEEKDDKKTEEKKTDDKKNDDKNQDGDKPSEHTVSFGQKPESTDNSDPDEPDITSAPGADGDDKKGEKGVEDDGRKGVEDGKKQDVKNNGGSETSDGGSSGQTFPITSSVSDDWLILVNKTHHLSEDYWPDDMVTVSSCVEGVGNKDTKKLRKVASDALEELISGAADAGFQIKMRTGFRSYNYQVSLFKSYAEKNGEEAANKYSARAGESEHQSGLCCDVSSPSVSWGLSYSYGKTDEGIWLAQHAHEYGFIIRYPENKEDITGYVYEPWHIRYVGRDAAAEIYEKGICFEEYLGITD